MAKHLGVITSDLVTQKRHDMHEEDGKIILSTTVDVQDIVDHNKTTRDHLWSGNFRGTPEMGMTLATTLPMIFWMQLKKTGCVDDKECLSRWLEKNPAFKATNARI